MSRLDMDNVVTASKIQDVEQATHISDDEYIDILLTVFSITPLQTMESIKDPLPSTCSWILKHTKYIQWSELNRAVLWISGPPGYGKSYLMKYLVYHHWRTSAVCYFFCDSKFASQRTGTIILRSILYQLISKNRRLIKHARPYWRMQGYEFVDSKDTLVKIMEACLQDPDLGDTLIIIDALNEIEDRGGASGWVSSLLSTTLHASNSVKLVFTSRPDTFEFSSGKAPFSISLEAELTSVRQDIGLFVDMTVSALGLEPELAQFTANQIKDQAGATYLWVSAAARDARALKDQSPLLSQEQIQHLLQGIPNELSSMYETQFGKIRSDNHAIVRCILQMIVAANYRLTLNELSWLLAAHQANYNSQHSTSVYSYPNPSTYYLTDIIDAVRHLTGISIESGKVHMRSTSLKEFLTEHSRDPKTLRQWYHFSEDEAKTTITQSCVWRIRSFNPSPDHPKEEILYAMTQWPSHFLDVQDTTANEVVESVARLYIIDTNFSLWQESYIQHRLRIETKKVEDTIAYRNTRSFGEDQKMVQQKAKQAIQRLRLTSTVSRERLCLILGHVRVFQYILAMNRFIYTRKLSDGWTVLCSAIDAGNVAIVRQVLEHAVDVEALLPEGIGALHLAMSKKDLAIAGMLLSKFPDSIHTMTINGRTALHLAAANGRKDAVELLLSHHQVGVSIADKEGFTPLHLAAQGGWDEVVLMFIERQTNREACDNQGRTPLILAAEAGRSSTVELLMQDLQIEDILRDRECVLHAAMRSGNNSLVGTLLDKGVRMGYRDGKGRTAFAYAKASCDQAILQRFLEQGANVEERDFEGLTLLHRMVAANEVGNAEFLLDRHPELIRVIANGGTCLHIAVSSRDSMEMIKLVMARLKVVGDEEAILELKDQRGYTPFHKAVLCWRSPRILTELRSMGANTEATNDEDETPLQTAIREQNEDLVEHLLLFCAANPMVPTKHGVSTLDLAEMSFVKKVIQHRVVGPKPHVDASEEHDNSLQGSRLSVEQIALRAFEVIKRALEISMKGKNLTRPRYRMRIELKLPSDATIQSEPKSQITETLLEGPHGNDPNMEDVFKQIMDSLQPGAQTAWTTYNVHLTMYRVENNSGLLENVARESERAIDKPLDFTTEEATISAPPFAAHGYSAKVFRMHWICSCGHQGIDHYIEHESGSVAEIAQRLRRRGVKVKVETWNPSAGFHDSIKLAVQQLWVRMNNLVLDLVFLFDLPTPQWITRHPMPTPASAGAAEREPIKNHALGGTPKQKQSEADPEASISTASQAPSAAGAAPSTEQSDPQGTSSLQSTGQVSRSTTPPQVQTQGPHIIPVKREDYLMVCIQKNRPWKERSDIKVDFKRDFETFEEIRAEHKKASSWWRRSFSLWSVQSIGFVRFTFRPGFGVDNIEYDMPPSTATHYKYEPKDVKSNPPIGKEWLMHFFKNPAACEIDDWCLKQFAKRIEGPAIPNQSPDNHIGWGIHLEEGFDWPRLVIYLALGGGSFIAVAVFWAVVKGSLEDGVAMATFIIAIETLAVTTLQVALSQGLL